MGYIMYGNGGGIESAIEQITNPTKVFGSINETFNEIVKTSQGMYSVGDLYLKYHAFDPRLGKDVYIIATSRCGKENYIKKYGCPQFVRYLVQVEVCNDVP